MKQEEFNKILLKYEAGRRTEEERRMAELQHKNLQSAKEIANPAQSKTRIFENINAGLKKESSRYWQRTSTAIAAVLLITASALITLPPPPLPRHPASPPKPPPPPVWAVHHPPPPSFPPPPPPPRLQVRS